MIEIIALSFLLGLVSGILAGMFGIGGGLVVVPVLIILFTRQSFSSDLVMIMAVATSLATIIPTAISSLYSHYRLGAVLWDRVFALTPGIMLGAILGTIFADAIQTQLLRALFIVYLFGIGLHMALDQKPKLGFSKFSWRIDFAASSAIGLISALLGIGGGTLTVPYLTHSHTPMRNAVAVASACGLSIAIVSTFSYMILGGKIPNLPAWSLGYVYLPAFFSIGVGSTLTAPLGAKIAYNLPTRELKRYFSIFIFLMAIKLLWG